MAVNNLGQDLQSQLSPDAKILTASDSEQFQQRLERWSDLELKIPTAIVLPSTAQDVAIVVKHAVAHAIPFVPKAGGHSLWSTIGHEGFILDLSLLNAIHVDVEAQTATLQAAVSTQEALDTVLTQGFAIASSNAAHVGMIPLAIQGGNSPTVGLYGSVSDSIISARVVTATRGLVNASASENADLLWAIKGAGQFFGVVVELRMRIWPLATLGRPDGKIQQWNFMYGIDQMREALQACAAVAQMKPRSVNGSIAIVAPPPHFKPTIMVAGQYFGSDADLHSDLGPLYATMPIMSTSRLIEVHQVTEAFSKLDRKGGFKGFCSAGLQRFSPETFEAAASIWLELCAASPVGKRSALICNFFSNEKALEVTGSAYTHRDICTWAMALIDGEDHESANVGFEYAGKAIAAFRSGQARGEYSSFLNHTRTAPIEERFRDAEVLAKLRELKKRWDPNGVFTDQLL